MSEGVTTSEKRHSGPIAEATRWPSTSYGEVMLYMRERHKGTTQEVAAARAGMSERTARRYEKAGKLPSQLKRPRTWRTRANPSAGGLALGGGATGARSGAASQHLVCAALRPESG